MKLYTEKEIIKMLSKRFELDFNGLMDSLTPISLPSDELIEHEADVASNLESESEMFLKGAKCVLEQIKQQADGN